MAGQEPWRLAAQVLRRVPETAERVSPTSSGPHDGLQPRVRTLYCISLFAAWLSPAIAPDEDVTATS